MLQSRAEIRERLSILIKIAKPGATKLARTDHVAPN